MPAVSTKLDTTYVTQQRDAFASGLVAQIGMNAYGVWMAIKSHADYSTGESWCGMRHLAEMTGLSAMTVQRSVKVLQEAHLLRIARREGQRVIYVARERMDLRIGSRTLVTVVIDYVPNAMRKRLDKLKAGGSDLENEDVYAYMELIPGDGVTWDSAKGLLSGRLRADEVPAQLPPEAKHWLPQNEATVSNEP